MKANGDGLARVSLTGWLVKPPPNG